MKDRANLPEDFSVYFWEYDLKKIDIEKYSKLVIERILNYGNTSSVIWLLNHYNIETIKKNAINNKQILPKTKKYWKLILDE